MHDTLVLNQVLDHLRSQKGIRVSEIGIRTNDELVTRSDIRIRQAPNCSSRVLLVGKSPAFYIDGDVSECELEKLIDKIWDQQTSDGSYQLCCMGH
jgi:hypothetical protein